jgi:hypothetical protein
MFDKKKEVLLDEEGSSDLEAKTAAERIARRSQRESFENFDLSGIDKLVEDEKKALKDRYYKDAEGIKRLYMQLKDFVGFGQEYEAKQILSQFRVMVSQYDAVVAVLEEQRDTYSSDHKKILDQAKDDRVNYEDHKVLIGSKRRQLAQIEADIDGILEQSLNGGSESIRELELRSKVIDIQNDLSVLNNENNAIATRLSVFDASNGAFEEARFGINQMLASFVTQRAALHANYQKAELASRLDKGSGAGSVRVLYLEGLRLVKQAGEVFGEGAYDVLRPLPSAGRIPLPAYGSRALGNGSRMEPWELYDRERQTRRKN